MKLPKSEVEWVANLAYIALSEQEKDKFANDLSGVLTYMETLKKVDTKGVEETRQITGLSGVTREDVVEQGKIKREDYLKEAPDSEDGFIKVKSVFNRE